MQQGTAVMCCLDLRPWPCLSAALIFCFLLSSFSASSKHVNYINYNQKDAPAEQNASRSLNWRFNLQFNKQTKKHFHDSESHEYGGNFWGQQEIIYPSLTSLNNNQTSLPKQYKEFFIIDQAKVPSIKLHYSKTIEERNRQSVQRDSIARSARSVDDHSFTNVSHENGNRINFIILRRDGEARDTRQNAVGRTKDTFGNGSTTVGVNLLEDTIKTEGNDVNLSTVPQGTSVNLSTVPQGTSVNLSTVPQGTSISVHSNQESSKLPRDVGRTVKAAMQAVKKGDTSRPPLQGAPKDLVTWFLAMLGVPRELHMLTPDLIRRYDYPVEEHFATTPDGYILGLHRIPGPRHSTPSTRPFSKPRVVLLVHCAACSSALYVIGKPEQSLGFLLADAGYDVWLGNFRGNTYSRNSTKFNPDKDKRFWDFSLDEIAEYDIPTMVNFVRRHTHVDKIFYVGHSLGTMAFFMSASTPASIVGKVRLFVALAPGAYRNNINGPFAIAMQLSSFFKNYLEGFNRGEVIGRVPLLYSALYFLCNSRSIFIDTCIKIFTFSVGGINDGNFDVESLPLLLTALPAGISTRTKSHVGQFITSDGLQKFDFGKVVNKRLYGSSRPPRYPLSAVTCPTALYWSLNDHHAAAKDSARTAAELPNVVRKKIITENKFNHVDFLIGNNARRLVYDDMMALMEQF